MKKQPVDLLKLFLSASAIASIAQAAILSEARAQDTKTPAPRARAAKPTKAPVAPPPASLSVKAFMDQVVQGNDAYKAAETNRKAAESYSHEAGLALAPTLFANVQQGSDGKPSPFASFSNFGAGFAYKTIDTNVYAAGVSKQFAMGLKTSVSYTATDMHYVGLGSQFFEASPKIEATLPLWRNLWGRETRTTIEAGRIGSLAKAEGQDAQAKAVMAEAEGAYWKLALAREALKVSEDSVERARNLFDWTDRRVRLALSDRSEHLQSTAQLKARELDLRSAQDNERSARLAFNSARGVNSDKVPETLEVMNAALVEKWETPSRTQTRPDIEASRLQAEAAEASARAAGERSKPTLELFGSYAFNSPQRATQGDALADSWKRDHPTSIYGVRLNMPLDISSTKRAQEGWAAEANASRTLISRKMFEQERDWQDVVARFQLAREKIRLYEDLEKAQREKLDHERDRQKSGRSTVAQVIIFESDYEQTQFARIGALAEVLGLNAQMKLYGVAYEAPKAPGETSGPAEPIN